MNILAVTPYYVPEGGGLEQYAHAILKRLAAASHRVRVVTTTRAEPTPRRVDGVDVYPISPMAFLGNAPVDPGLVGHLRRTIRAFAADVVVAHAPVPGPAEAAAAAAAREDIPFILTYHAGRLRGSNLVLDGLAALARATTHPLLCRRSSRLVAVSPFVQAHALAGYEERTVIVPPGVEAAFVPGTSDDRTILFVGPLDRHYRWKGVDVLVRAFDELRRRGVPGRLRLVGSGDRWDAFRSWARGRDDVQVDGRLPRAALIEAMQSAAVTVLPSTTDAEAFGMVLAEANACGRPVVGARVGGIPDFIQPGHNGQLVAPGDARGLSACLEDLLSCPSAMDAMGRRGRELVRQRHDWDLLAERTERVLSSAGRSGP